MNVRARMAAAFVLGLAAGALLLTVGLWWSGSLRVNPMVWHRNHPATPAVDLTGTVAEAKNLPPAPLPEVPPPAVSQPSVPAAPAPKVGQPTPAVPPPAVPQPAPPPPAGGKTNPGSTSANEANRMAPEAPPHLALPIAGLDPSKIADTFADARDGRRHEALDIMSPRGTPVKAVAEGNVVKLFTSKQGGLTVYQFDDSQTYCFYYAHLDRYAPGLQEGTLLRKGDVLGYVGSTGDASPDAPHLHLAVFKLGPEKKWWQGTPIDPLPLLQ